MINDTLVITSVGVGSAAATGAAIRSVIGLINYRADRKRVARDGSRVLDWLTKFVLGPNRIDHEPCYSCSVSAVVFVSAIFMITGPTDISSLAKVSNSTLLVMASCMLVGGITCLYGISMGTNFDPIRNCLRIWLWLRRRPPAPPLDMRRAYRVGASGAPTIIGSLVYYSILILPNPQLTGEAAFIGFVALGVWFQLLRFIMEIRRINKALPVLIEHEIERQVVEDEVRQLTQRSA